jgi:hypothetical protein
MTYILPNPVNGLPTDSGTATPSVPSNAGAAPDASAPPQPPAVDGSTPSNDGGIAPAAGQPQPVQPGTPAGEAQHHGILGEIFQTLAGGKKKVWEQTPNGPVATYQDLKPGEMARGILAAAITGLASGYDPANRGKGPAMSSAFSAGFKGEEAARQNKEKQDADQAQKQFQNQNISDEKTLRLHADARAQQESILKMQKDMADLAKMKQEAENGQTLFNEGRQDRVLQQLSQYDAKLSSGWTEIPHPNNGETFGWADAKEAEKAANDFTSHLLKPGSFHTEIVYNPITHLYVPMQQPEGYDEQRQVRFAKMDKNGEPMKDANGKYIPSGEKDADGHVLSPADMTNKDYHNIVTQKLDAQYKSMSTAHLAAEVEELREKAKKERANAAMDSHYAEANGNPFAVRTTDGTFYMSDKERSLQANQARQYVALYGGLAQKARGDLEKAATPEERKEATTNLENYQAMEREYTGQLSKLNTRISQPIGLAQTYVDRFTEDGKFDSDKAIAEFDKNAKAGNFKTWTPEDLAKTKTALQGVAQKQEAAKNAPPLPADSKVQQSIGIFQKQNTPKEEVPGHVADSVAKNMLTTEQGNQLLKYYGLPPLPTPPPNKPSPAGADTIKGAAKAIGSVLTGETPLTVIP